MPLKLGIVTPALHMNPRFEPPGWEETASVGDIISVVSAAERAGYDWISCSEHIAIPRGAANIRGGRYFDPFTTLGFLAAHTHRIRLLTHMVVLPYHHPLELLKRLGTLDVLSAGRVLMGVGVGSLEPEFEVLGHQFHGRGERADDALRALRVAWGMRVPEYHGQFFQFRDFIVDPSGLPRRISIWIGGRTRRSLRRALELGDAWMPFRLLPDELSAALADPYLVQLASKRSEPIELIFAPEPPIDPIGDPESTRQLLRTHVELGATGLSLRFRHDSAHHYIEQMEATLPLIREVEHAD